MKLDEVFKSYLKEFRRRVILLNENKDFQLLIIFLIFGNCITLAMYDPLNVDSRLNKNLQRIGIK